MASDIHTLYHDILGIEKAVILGHDVGSMVALALALRFRSGVAALVIMEAPHPGSEAYEISIRDPEYSFLEFFHFWFHNAPDLPELLTAGKEDIYLKHFFDRLCYNGSFYTPEDLEHYAASFKSVGGMRAGFETYRAFKRDHEELTALRESLGKMEMPVLATGGKESVITKWVGQTAREVATRVTEDIIRDCGHWCAEENPEELVRIVHKSIVAELVEMWIRPKPRLRYFE